MARPCWSASVDANVLHLLFTQHALDAVHHGLVVRKENDFLFAAIKRGPDISEYAVQLGHCRLRIEHGGKLLLVPHCFLRRVRELVARGLPLQPPQLHQLLPLFDVDHCVDGDCVPVLLWQLVEDVLLPPSDHHGVVQDRVQLFEVRCARVVPSELALVASTVSHAERLELREEVWLHGFDLGVELRRPGESGGAGEEEDPLGILQKGLDGLSALGLHVLEVVALVCDDDLEALALNLFCQPGH
mmetsp:Transcript_16278/g.63453  ORF Transcript_16278/g.63453 Transcript_16278/m.63453 type:complete len:244 (+) Transcript_16278:479-1210(+)